MEHCSPFHRFSLKLWRIVAQFIGFSWKLWKGVVCCLHAENLTIVCMCVCACRVGIELPTIEVRYENLSIEADCYVGNRALPSNWNTARNFFEVPAAIDISSSLESF